MLRGYEDHSLSKCRFTGNQIELRNIRISFHRLRWTLLGYQPRHYVAHCKDSILEVMLQATGLAFRRYVSYY